MKQKHNTILRMGIMALIVAIIGCFAFDAIFFDHALFAQAPLSMLSLATVPLVGTIVNDTPTVADLDAAGIAQEDIDSDITRLSPNKFPFDTITRTIRKATPTKSQEVGYYQKSSKPMADKLNASASGNGAALSAPCNSYTYDSTANAGAGNEMTSICIAPALAKLWRKSDTLLMFNLTLPGPKGAAVIGGAGTHTDYVMFHVIDKSANAIEIVPIGGAKGTADNADKWVVPNFTSDTILIRMGQAKKEKDLTTDPIAIYPEKGIQYCQNFITQVEESTFAAMTKKEIETGIEEFDRDNLESMRGEMELSFLFGQKYKTQAGNGENIYFTGGIARNITKTVEYGTGGGDRSMTAQMYMDMLQEVFVGTSGSAERVLFGGSELIKSFELLRESQKNISGTSQQETYHGVIVTKIVSTFGTIRLVHDPIFDEIGLQDYGLILDMAYIFRRPFLPMIAKEIDLVSSGISNAKARTVQECSCVTLKYPDCHAWVKPKA